MAIAPFLAVPIEISSDHLFEFRETTFSLNQRSVVLLLISSPGSLGIDKIQKPSRSCAISRSRCFKVLYGLRQDRGVIQPGHLLTRPDLSQEVVHLKTSQIFQLVLLCPRGCDRSQIG